tara:strand:- start:86 stop:586 length:501 start_codon:yes stop_codon:yes gene_type:complete
MAAEGVFPKINGDIFYASEVNYLARPILLVYTGTGFNASGNATNAVELAAVTAGSLTGGKYVKIRILCTHDVSSSNAPAGGAAALKIEEKETGGAYSTILDHTLANQSAALGIHSDGIDVVEYYHTITAGEFSNGLQFKITGTTNQGGGGGNLGSMANVQTVLELI